MPESVLALSGGVGGAKLSLGLDGVLEPGELCVLANTADDFRHLGLYICPDIDTLLYTLSGRANRSQGWGLEGESWSTMETLESLGGDTWFRLGDRDLATHLLRTGALAAGKGLVEVTDDLAARMGVQSRVLPMSEQPVATLVQTAGGELPFQHYFVRLRCEPPVSGFRFGGLEDALPVAEVMQLLHSGSLRRIVICPSNPFVSIDPMLRLPGLWEALRDAPADVVAVSPIVGGTALKGPAAKMMAELGLAVTATGVAAHYARHYPGLVDHFVIDESDATLGPQIEDLGMCCAVNATVMGTREDKERLARTCLSLERL